MLDAFAMLQGCQTLSNLLFEPLIVIDVALHQVFNDLIRTTSSLGGKAVEFFFHLSGEANLHAVSLGAGSCAVNMAAVRA